MLNLDINGETKVFGVIGNPIKHTFSPFIQNTLAKREEKNITYLPFHVLENNLEEAIKGAFALSIKGLNVTVPHKKEVMKYIFKTEKRASVIGAVNTLKYTENGYIGYNTDIIGIKSCFELRNISLKDKDVLILGAGGSARAALVLCAEEKVSSVTVANRTKEKAELLCDDIKKYYNINAKGITLSDTLNIKKCDIIIQTTTLGFGKNIGLSPLNKDFYKDKSVSAVLDVIYAPWKTQFLIDAEKMGITAVNGFDMLVYQAVAAQEIWLEVVYSNDVKIKLRNDLETLLGRN